VPRIDHWPLESAQTIQLWTTTGIPYPRVGAFASCPAGFNPDSFDGASELPQFVNTSGPPQVLTSLDLLSDGVLDGSDLVVLPDSRVAPEYGLPITNQEPPLAGSNSIGGPTEPLYRDLLSCSSRLKTSFAAPAWT
jgi:hypothetical protein